MSQTKINKTTDIDAGIGGPVMTEEGPVRQPIGEVEGGMYDTPAKIAFYRLSVTLAYAEGRAKGMHLVDPRKARSVQLAALRAGYGIRARRWEQAAAELQAILRDWVENGVPEKFLV